MLPDRELFDAVSFDQTLRSDTAPLPLFRAALKQAGDTLSERFHAGHSATELVYARARVIDELMVRAWQRFFPDADDNLALLAVGGYGRGELHPHSDVDVQILLRKDPQPYAEAIEAFLMFLWDIGLEIGHSVRTLDECVEEANKDITVATNLQEARLLSGPVSLYEEQKQCCAPDKIWPSQEFFAAKWQEQTRRHQKYNDTAYNLEPNIKEGPGGLRDIQMIGWVAKRHFGAETLHDLVPHGFLSEQEYQSLHRGQAFLWQIRFGLHLLSKRREDRLLFDHQRVLAKQFGYFDDPRRLAVESFMKAYYRTVMELNRLNEMLLQLFQEEILYKRELAKPTPINKRFQLRKGFLEVTRPDTFKFYPFALLEIFLLLSQHPEAKGVRANTIRLIRDHSSLIDNDFRNDLRCRSLFMEILRQPGGVTHELRRMNNYGILAAYIPGFGNIVGQMQHDLFHVYTVDEHTLFVIRNLRRFTVPEHHHEFPLCSRVMAALPKQELVLIAGLFHDIAKGRGGDHSKLGSIDAEAFCRQHDISPYDTKLVVWLVENHLLMSMTAQSKDISDPEVIREFARTVGDQLHLNYLYVLTVADIRATSPKVWNSWKDALLRELYTVTKAMLRRGLDNPIVRAEYVQHVKSQAKQRLEKAGTDAASIDQLWERLGDEYFVRYSLDEILWHSQSLLQADKLSTPLTLIREETRRGGTEAFIYTREHDHQFAIITAVIEQMGMTVVDARILSSRDAFTLDTFIILDNENKPISDQDRITTLARRLEQQLADPEAQQVDINLRMDRQARHFKFPTEVEFWQDENNQRTAMKVTAYDRPGLLSRIGSALYSHKLRLQNAKIATFGERAEDIFYITDTENNPLQDEQSFAALEKTVKDFLSD